MKHPFKVILKPLQRFATQKPNASLLLFLATILAMVLANSPWAHFYHQLLSYPVGLQFVDFRPFDHHGETMPMLSFVNDALMAVFFFLVGLEIKQEILIGELSSFRKAMLPVIAACGGMIVPVLFYLLVCHTSPEMRGAAIPMATDIAFALAVLGLLGKRVPLNMRIFLTALAVVDDVGGIVIIAIFYSSSISYAPLLISFALLVLLFNAKRLRIHSDAFYYAVGFFVWMFFLESGIHPTIAGVLVAFTVPARPVIRLDRFTDRITSYVEMLNDSNSKSLKKNMVLTSTQIQVLNNIHTVADKAVSPLQRMVDKLHPMVYYFILPLFAFVNAGVTFGEIQLSVLPGVPLAVLLGLFVGKSTGIFLFTYLAARFGLVARSESIARFHLLGLSMLGGIGFTVALFIANLSFTGVSEVGTQMLDQAKLGVFAGSFISGLCGYLILRKVLPKRASSRR